ncbi:hypothetical protein CVIRNUC_002073 [Coccomyxa viridis]|uniref:BFN domain-containing protein n=1 Tax=Coccomyxa viridis TaxID=1274662 RepID=A0AAV1HY03_9CHLO|nr:hypothetical protein CVIRNUC_002073 [Coccomyxa viridis]
MKAMSFKLSDSSLAIPTSSCKIRQQINHLCSRCPGVSSSFTPGPSGVVLALAGSNGPSPKTTAQLHHRSRRTVVCSAGYQAYPFDVDDYYKVQLQVVTQTSRERGHLEGTVILMRSSDRTLQPGAGALVLGVGGDTLLGLGQLLESQLYSRPMALDLLWQVLQRGQDISKRDWKVLRVAIVELRDQTYIGRLFFGDADSGAVVWDCDCRPSDGCWIALKAKCPIYVRKTVWKEHATPIERRPPEGKAAVASLAEDATGTNALTSIRGDEPEPLKRLKREMGVALHEEDYTAAARIRDHPFMRMHMRILEHRRNKREDAAKTMEQELEQMITEQSGSPDRD